MQYFDEMDLDILKEIGNIGAGNAATALSEMVGKTVDIGVAKCELIPYDQVTDILSGPETIIVGILVQMQGDVEGYIMLAQELPDAAHMLSALMGQEIELNEEDFPGMMAALEPMTEICNILCGAYIAAISSMTGANIRPTVPEMAIDMAMAIMNIPILVYGEMDTVMRLETSFECPGETLHGHFFLMPTIESSHKLREALLSC